MLTKYVFDGLFSDGRRENVTGPLHVYLDERSIRVGPPPPGIWNKLLRVTPFYRHMFCGATYAEGLQVFAGGYELAISGKRIGTYEEGGGPDGDFDIFPLEDARIRGTYGADGLTIGILANSGRGMTVCYGAGTKDENVHDATQIATQFVVPPPGLANFLLGEDYPMAGLYEGWFFRQREVSQGTFQVEGSDLWGFTVSRKGADPAVLMEQCLHEVHKLSKDRRTGFMREKRPRRKA